jgi:hypothetical protein
MKPITQSNTQTLLMSSLSFINSQGRRRRRRCDDKVLLQSGVDVIFQIQGGAITETDDDMNVTDDTDTDYDSEEQEEEEEEEEEEEYDDDSETEEDETSGEESQMSFDSEEEETNDDIPKPRTKNAIANTEYDEPLALSPMQDMGITLGVMIMCNKLDLTNTKIIRFARYVYG